MDGEILHGVLRKEPRPSVTVAIAVCAVTVDYLTGPLVRFPILFIVPVALAACGRSRWLALGLATSLPLARLGDWLIWAPPWSVWIELVNVVVQAGVLILLALVTATAARQARESSREVKILRGLLSICSFCKRIHRPDGQWEMLESYIRDHSEAEFSHGLCPDCIKEHYPDFNPTEGDA
ncbi:MAG: hypothetical protein JXB13_07485 [Phycisphaerae bacterium]|nr:hypothetical protein [Phycisphaerae bacterium]